MLCRLNDPSKNTPFPPFGSNSMTRRPGWSKLQKLLDHFWVRFLPVGPFLGPIPTVGNEMGPADSGSTLATAKAPALLIALIGTMHGPDPLPSGLCIPEGSHVESRSLFLVLIQIQRSPSDTRPWPPHPSHQSQATNRGRRSQESVICCSRERICRCGLILGFVWRPLLLALV